MAAGNSFRELAKTDFELFYPKIELDCDDFAKKHLIVQSIEGHARAGHCFFDGRRFPNATIEDVIDALGIDIERFKQERQDEIDRAARWVAGALRGEKYARLELDGLPLFRINLFSDICVNDINSVLSGVLLGGLMDNFSWRQKVLRKYGHQMGGGKCVAINVPELEKLKLTMSDLSDIAHKQWFFQVLRENNVIPGQKIARGTRDVVCGFLRHEYGPGVSDDSAFIYSGIIYGTDAALGLLLADAIDTWDKCSSSIVHGGQDEMLARTIAKSKNAKAKLAEEEIVEFIYLSAVSPFRQKDYPDCSQRYFLQKDRNTGLSAVRSHMMFISHTQKYISTLPRDRSFRPRQRVGYNRVKNTKFYSEIIKPRLYAYALKGSRMPGLL